MHTIKVWGFFHKWAFCKLLLVHIDCELRHFFDDLKISQIHCLFVSFAAISTIADMSVVPESICFSSSFIIWICANSLGVTLPPSSVKLLFM